METTNCPKARLGKESEFSTVGLCENCGQPVAMSRKGIYIRSSRWTLGHVSQEEYEQSLQRARNNREWMKANGF